MKLVLVWPEKHKMDAVMQNMATKLEEISLRYASLMSHQP